MKNNLKKITLLLLCLILCTCSCFTVEASAVNLSTVLSDSPSYFSFDYSYDNLNYGRSYEITLDSSESDVHAVMYYAPTSNDGTTLGILLVSSDYFTFSRKQWKNSTCSGNPQFSSQDIQSEKHAAGFYYCSLDFVVSKPSTSISINASSMPMMDFYSVFGTYLELSPDSLSLYDLVVYLYSNNFTWEDSSHGGGGGSFGSYAGSPSVDIELPENLRYMCFFESSIDDYVHQVQWDMPDDDSLNVEVMFNVSWKEGNLELGDLRYKKWHALKNEDDFGASSCSFSFNESSTLDMIFDGWGIDRPVTANISEVYIRFSKEIDGVVNYSLWTKIFVENLDASNDKADSITGSFSEGNWTNQSVQSGAIVDGSDWVNIGSPGYDSEGNLLPPSSNDSLSFDSWSDFLGIFSDFGSALSGAFSFVGEFPQMVSQFFSFMPPGILSILALGLIMAVVLRFLGR